MERIPLLSAVAGLVMLASAQSSAQQVTGTVRDSMTRAPVAGAVVELLSDAGPVTRALSNERGEFRLAWVAGANRARVKRIGYRPVVLPLPRLNDENIVLEVMMSAANVVFATIDVVGDRLCPQDASGAKARAMWEQVRDGLLQAITSRDALPAQVKTLTYERSVNTRGAIGSQSVRTRMGPSTRPYRAAESASSLAQDGYLRDETTAKVLYAPDADVLFDESFASTHCFRIVPATRGRAGSLGVAFEPIPGRSVVDVAGVVWIDERLKELRSMEFRYTGAEHVIDTAGTGGSIDFRNVPNGVVFIERWSIRTAPAVSVRGGTGRGRPTSPNIATLLHETGGEVAWASWPGGLTWAALLGSVTGQVVERGTGRPIPDVLVNLEGTDERTKTDSAGRFAFTELLPGPYTLAIEDSALAQLGLPSSFAGRIGTATRIDVQRAPLVLPPIELRARDDVLADICKGQRGNSRTAVLVGEILAPDGRPAAGARAEAVWLGEISVSGGAAQMEQRRADVDNLGRLLVCGVDRGKEVRIRLIHERAATTDVVVVVPTDRPLHAFSVRLTPP